MATDVTTITEAQAGDYYIEATLKSSGCTGSTTLNIEETAFPVSVELISSSDNSSCIAPDGSATIQVNGESDATPYDIQWFDAGANQIASNTMSIGGLLSGSYSVEVQLIGTDCSNQLNFDIGETIDSPDIPSITADDVTICEGESINLYVNITGGTGPFSIDINNGVGSISNYNSGDPISVTPSETTDYAITALSDANGCSPSDLPSDLRVNVDNSLVIYDVTGGGEICEEETDPMQIRLSGSQTGVQYRLLRDGDLVESRLGTGNTLSFTVDPVDGEYTIEANTANDCQVMMNGLATVSVFELPILSGEISGETLFCSGAEAISYSVEDPGNVIFIWSLPSGFKIIAGETSSEIIVSTESNVSSGTISVFARNDCGDSQTLSIDVSPIGEPKLVIEAEDVIEEGVETSFNLLSNTDLESAIWDFGDGGTANGLEVVHTFLDRGNHQVNVNATSVDGCEGETRLLIRARKRQKVFIKNVVTPNGDGQNDVLWIDNIDEFPNNSVKFLDRWGVEIAAFDGYENDWDLRSKGDYIPAGSYLCIVRLDDGDTYSMTVTVIRE